MAEYADNQMDLQIIAEEAKSSDKYRDLINAIKEGKVPKTLGKKIH